MKKRMQFERNGYLAIDPKALFEYFDEGDAPDNAEQGKVALVSIRGPLVRAGSWWCDSYESISARLGAALAGPAETVILRIDSPGGDAMGLFEAVHAARAKVAESKKRVIAYVDGRACSAAYAWACVAGEIVVPPSGEAGSVGVIGCRTDATEAARKAGYKLEIFKSGARKDWGHPQTKVTPEERESQQQAIDDLAAQFFALVSEARDMSVDAVDALEAGTFLGTRAVEAGLADRVGTLDALLSELDGSEAKMTLAEIMSGLKAAAEGNGPDALKAAAALAAMQPQAEAAPAAESDEDEESAEDEGEDEDEESAESDEDEESAESDEDEESAEHEDEEPKDDKAKKGKKAAKAGTVSAATAGAVARKGNSLAKRLARLEARQVADKRNALLDARPDISAALRATLADKPVADVKAILAGIPKPKRAKPAAGVTAPNAPARPAGAEAQGLPAAEKLALDMQMGLATVQSTGVIKTSHTLVLGAPVPVSKSPKQGA